MPDAEDATVTTLGTTIARPELDAMVGLLKEAVTEWGRARSLFITGSAVTGEWSVWRDPHGLRFLSDVDIGVVCDARGRDPEQQLRGWVRDRVVHLARDRGWSDPPDLNIGFFTPDELRSQAPKPGTLEMINQAMIVWGDRSVREHFPNLTAEDLTWEESIRLLGNRVMEVLAHPPGEAIEVVDYYRLSKLYCDMATALLIPEGAYVSGYRKRAERLPALLNERPLPPGLARHKNALIEAVEFWTGFRERPEIEVLSRRYSAEPLGEEGRALFGGVWCEARQLLGVCLEHLLPHRLLDGRGRPVPASLGRTSGWGSLRQRVREWKWLARYGPSPITVWRRGLRIAFRLSPVEITYLTGFMLFQRAVDGPPPIYLDRDLVAAMERWYPLPHGEWTSGEDVRHGLLELWRYWLPRI